jgi:hypothetical protein
MFGYSHKQANDLIANKTGMKGSKAFPLSTLVTFLPKGVLITLQKYASTSDLKTGNKSRVGHLSTSTAPSWMQHPTPHVDLLPAAGSGLRSHYHTLTLPHLSNGS